MEIKQLHRVEVYPFINIKCKKQNEKIYILYIFFKFDTSSSVYAIWILKNVGFKVQSQVKSRRFICTNMVFRVAPQKSRMVSNRMILVRSNHNFGPKRVPVTFSGCNCLSSITWGFLETQIWQFCFASSMKKILFEKLPSCCSNTRELGLNAKYAITCRKTVLIPKNDEESTYSSVFGNTFTYNGDIFSETSKTMIHRPFNICNHSSLFKFSSQFCQSPFL